jgi:hypothetical protein
MTWDDSANVCSGSQDAAAASDAGDMSAAQPLTRADCEAAGMAWNDGNNVCGVETMAEAQPLTRADCEKASMTWNEATNVCGSAQAAAPDAASEAAAAAAAAAVAAAPVKKAATEKAVRKAKTRHGTRKHAAHKKTRHAAPAAKKQRRGFFQWLNGKNKKS